MSAPTAFDIIIIGAGPAGQKAAIQGAKSGKRVALLERERGIGGSCVYRGTIPSKTLRESALHLDRLRRASAAFEFSLKPDAEISSLLSRLEEVVRTHDTYMSKQLRRNGISLFHGRARFLNDRTVEMQTVDGARQHFTADHFVIATGSSDRQLKALADAVAEASEKIAKRRVLLRNVDAQAESGWILIDLGDVIVHLFSPSQRRHFNLEGLWSEAKVLLRVQ